MEDAKRPGRKKAISEEMIKQIVEKSLHSTPMGQTHWSDVEGSGAIAQYDPSGIRHLL
jgi:hypothetical protein